MEQALQITLGIVAVLVGGLLKFLHSSQKTLRDLVFELRKNTKSIQELREYQKDHARAQKETNATLQELLELSKEDAARATAGDRQGKAS